MMQVNLGTAPRHFYISNRDKYNFQQIGNWGHLPILYLVLLAEFGGKGERSENRLNPHYWPL